MHKNWEAEIILVGNFPRQLNFPLLYELQYQIVVQIGAQRKCLGEETLFVRAREETSSTHRASHLRAGLSLSWPSHVHIQPNLLKSCQTTTATQRSCRYPKGYATAGVCHSRLRSPSDLWHSSVTLMTKEELSVSTRQTRDNKATKNRSMIAISLQGKGWRSTKIGSRNYSCWQFPAATQFLSPV